MIHGLLIAIWAVTGVLLAQVAVLCAQCWAAILPGRIRRHDAASRPRVAILIPAHNEEAVIERTLSALRPQLRSDDQVLVVADNCTDETASIARSANVRVIERHDEQRRGKGYALAAGIAALPLESYDVLIVLDADCIPEDGAIDALAAQVAATHRPAQAIYLMHQPPDATSARSRVSAWAFMVKNLVRPLGLSRLGLPVQLTGTGMAFPRETLDKVTLASGNIVEDMQLGLDLAMAGFAPKLCPLARVTGVLPSDRKIALKQRQRWEHGHIRTLLVQGPRFAMLGLLRGRLRAVAIAIDLMVPPLSLLVVLLLAWTIVANAATLIGVSSRPAEALVLAAIVLVATVFVAWLKFGRHCLPPRSVFAAIPYIAWKLPMYAMFLIRPESKWIRTQREAAQAAQPAAEPLPR